jgi:hypothetical protein
MRGTRRALRAFTGVARERKFIKMPFIGWLLFGGLVGGVCAASRPKETEAIVNAVERARLQRVLAAMALPAVATSYRPAVRALL